MEIERKFLMPELPPGLERSTATRIEQGYIAIADDGTKVRVRRRDRDAVLTVKGGGDGSRTEEEIEIDSERFGRLWPLTEGWRIEKTRHTIPAGGDLTIELDVFAGALSRPGRERAPDLSRCRRSCRSSAPRCRCRSRAAMS